MMSQSESIDVLVEILCLLRTQRDLWQKMTHVSYTTREFNVAYYEKRIEALGIALVSLGREEPVPFPEPSPAL